MNLRNQCGDAALGVRNRVAVRLTVCHLSRNNNIFASLVTVGFGGLDRHGQIATIVIRDRRAFPIIQLREINLGDLLHTGVVQCNAGDLKGRYTRVRCFQRDGRALNHNRTEHASQVASDHFRLDCIGQRRGGLYIWINRGRDNCGPIAI